MQITQRRLDRGRIAQIRLHGVDLPDLAGGLEVSGQFRPPHRDPDPVIPPAQRADDIPAQKPRSAENRDESFQIRCHGIHSWGPFLRKECVLSRLVSGRFAMRNPHPRAGVKHAFDNRVTEP